MQGRYWKFSRRGRRRPFGARTISCQSRSPILAQKNFWGKLKLKLLPRAVLEIPSSDFHFLTYFGSEWTPWANCGVFVLDLHKRGRYGPQSWGPVTFGENPLRDAGAPIWPVHVIALEDLRKTVFVPWESAPIWGRYGGLKIGQFGVFWHFGVDFLGNRPSEFHQISTVDRSLLLLSHVRKKSKIVSSEVSRKCEKPRNLGFGAVWGSPTFTQFQVAQYLKMFATY